MRNILTFNEFINENSTPEYDEILDLYNEVGLEGMSNDEVDYLKSGGTTKLPSRFESSDSVKLDSLKTFLLLNPDWIVDFPYNNVGFGLDNLFRISFKDEDLFDELITIMYGSHENYQKDLYDIKKVERRKENEGNTETVYSDNVTPEEREEHIQNKKDSANLSPGPEYKISVIVPKVDYDYLIGESLPE